MSTLALIVVFGLAMSVIALSGAVSILLPDRWRERLEHPFVALAAGSLLGGALFHMLPEAVAELGPSIPVWAWAAAGFVLFMALEELLSWHHRHGETEVAPVTWLLLAADGLHNLLGGLAIGGAFVVDPTLGIVAWTAAAAHEVPQELGDFAVLVGGGWGTRDALLANFLSALTFPLGAVTAWAVSEHVQAAGLVALGAGSFVYIAASDLIPELKRRHGGRAGPHFLTFLAGLGLLLAVRILLVPR